MTPESGSERKERRYRRADFAFDVRLKSGSVATLSSEQGTTIGAGGMFVATNVPSPVGTLIEFELILREAGTRALSGSGEVRWIRPPGSCRHEERPGMGIAFRDLSSDSVARIDRLVRMKADAAQTRAANTAGAREILQGVDENELLAGITEDEPSAALGGMALPQVEIDLALSKIFVESWPTRAPGKQEQNQASIKTGKLGMLRRERKQNEPGIDRVPGEGIAFELDERSVPRPPVGSPEGIEPAPASIPEPALPAEEIILETPEEAPEPRLLPPVSVPAASPPPSVEHAIVIGTPTTIGLPPGSRSYEEQVDDALDTIFKIAGEPLANEADEPPSREEQFEQDVLDVIESRFTPSPEGEVGLRESDRPGKHITVMPSTSPSPVTRPATPAPPQAPLARVVSAEPNLPVEDDLEIVFGDFEAELLASVPEPARRAIPSSPAVGREALPPAAAGTPRPPGEKALSDSVAAVARSEKSPPPTPSPSPRPGGPTPSVAPSPMSLVPAKGRSGATPPTGPAPAAASVPAPPEPLPPMPAAPTAARTAAPSKDATSPRRAAVAKPPSPRKARGLVVAGVALVVIVAGAFGVARMMASRGSASPAVVPPTVRAPSPSPIEEAPPPESTAPTTPTTTPSVVPSKMITKVDATVATDGLHVIITGDGTTFVYATQVLDSPERFVLDVKGVTLAEKRSKITVVSARLDQIRIGRDAEKVRFVLDLKGNGAPVELKDLGGALDLLVK